MPHPKVIGYLRVSPKIEDIDHRIEAMKNITQKLLFIEKGVRGHVPLDERPQFQLAISQINTGDTLLIWWMTDFGLGFKLAYDVITDLLSKGITVKTHHQNLCFKPNDDQTDALLRLIKGYEEIETFQRLMAAELGRRKLKDNKGEWDDKFRGRRANHELHKSIAKLLLTDRTLQAIADETGSSISTVKRVKSKLQRKAEISSMEISHRKRDRRHDRHTHHIRQTELEQVTRKISALEASKKYKECK
ncbi:MULTISPECIES: recombinase family protein [Vibrio]|uniref:recombinase family protein n=1 Tax=Vibrio TaxID=662 RepID=UPI000B5CEABF|nr:MULTISPECIES: recombinase family protein [Vibrio]HBV75836.1 recombinase [Vibrio sp.]